MKLYVIDDSIMTWDWITDIALNLEGLEVFRYTGNAGKAIKRFSEILPDVAILNHKIYGRSGEKVLKKIKEIKPDTTIAVLRDNILPEHELTLRSLGAVYFFDKKKDSNKILRMLLKPAPSNRLFLRWYHYAVK